MSFERLQMRGVKLRHCEVFVSVLRRQKSFALLFAVVVAAVDVCCHQHH